MDPPLSWLQWFAISLPVSTLSILAIWAFLHVNYRWEADLEIPRMRKNTDTLTKTHYYVLFISALTIALWCMEKSMEEWVGDMGIIAIIPLLAFFGTGILSKVSLVSPSRWSVELAWMLMEVGGFPFVPLVDRLSRHGRYRPRKSDTIVRPPGRSRWPSRTDGRRSGTLQYSGALFSDRSGHRYLVSRACPLLAPYVETDNSASLTLSPLSYLCLSQRGSARHSTSPIQGFSSWYVMTSPVDQLTSILTT